MILEEIIRAVDNMTEQERRLLRRHLDRAPLMSTNLAPRDRTKRLNVALDAMRDGVDQAELNEMTAAMTEEYIEAWDESEWTK